MARSSSRSLRIGRSGKRRISVRYPGPTARGRVIAFELGTSSILFPVSAALLRMSQLGFLGVWVQRPEVLELFLGTHVHRVSSCPERKSSSPWLVPYSTGYPAQPAAFRRKRFWKKLRKNLLQSPAREITVVPSLAICSGFPGPGGEAMPGAEQKHRFDPRLAWPAARVAGSERGRRSFPPRRGSLRSVVCLHPKPCLAILSAMLKLMSFDKQVR